MLGESMIQKFFTASAGLQHFLRELELQHFRVLGVKSVNFGRHFVVDTDRGRFYVVFKREFFHSFASQFPHFSSHPMYSAMGESLNKECLNVAIRRSAVLVFVYPSGRIYRVFPALFKRFAEGNGLYRVQSRGFFDKKLGKKVYETTLSIPLTLLDRFDVHPVEDQETLGVKL